MALSRADAAAALARVEADAEARTSFLAAYTGDEDGVAALREAADPGQPSAASVARAERIAGWQRVAFGRTNSPEDEDAAAHAGEEIAREEDHRASIAAALEGAVGALRQAQGARSADAEPVARQEESAGTAVRQEETPDGAVAQPVEAPRRRARSVITVVIAVVIGIAVGALITSGLISTRTPTAVATPITKPPALESQVGASITRTYTAKQVDGWFAATAETADTFPQPSYLSFVGLHDSNTRFVTTQATGWSLWVGKSTTGETCLLVNGTVKIPNTSFSNCSSAAAINQGKALVINTHGIDAKLSKRDLVVAVSQQ